MVGYNEYTHSLAMFDALLARVSPEEFRVMDELVKSRDEFSVFTNLSRRLPSPSSSLSEPVKADDDFRRRGLGWVMALARVELGAMVAGFTERPDPFEVLPPTRFELSQYEELMLDSARMHYLALRNDPVAQFYWAHRNKQVTLADRLGQNGGGLSGGLLGSYAQQFQEQRAIAYARRVAIAEEFVYATARLGAGRLSPAQLAELKSWDRDLTQLRDVILYKVLALGETSSSTAATAKSRLVSNNACPRLLQIANADAKNGHGKVRSYNRPFRYTTFARQSF